MSQKNTIITICYKLTQLKHELEENKQKMHNSNIFLDELEKWLHRLRHQQYLSKLDNPQVIDDNLLQIKRMMNQVTEFANQVWDEVRYCKQNIAQLQKQMRQLQRQLKWAYEVKVLRA